MGSRLHLDRVPINHRNGHPRTDWLAIDRRRRNSNRISSIGAARHCSLWSARGFYNRELRVSGRTAFLQRDDAGAGSGRPPRSTLRHGCRAGIRWFDYRCSPDIPVFHGTNANTRSNSRPDHQFPEKRSPFHYARWPCFDIRADCASFSAVLAAAVSLLPGSQRDPRKEARGVAPGIPGCSAHVGRGKKISRNFAVHSDIVPVSGRHGNDHREHGSLRNFRDGIREGLGGDALRHSDGSSCHRELWHWSTGRSLRTQANSIVGPCRLDPAPYLDDRRSIKNCLLDRGRMHRPDLRRRCYGGTSAPSQPGSRCRGGTFLQPHGSFITSCGSCRSIRVGIRGRWTYALNGNRLRLPGWCNDCRNRDDACALDVARRARQFYPAGPLSMTYNALRWIDGVALHWFYRDIRIAGRERIPTGVPLLIAANHQNALVDSLIVAWVMPRRIAMTAKATLTENPLIALLFRIVGVVPLRRVSDEARKATG